MGIDGNRQLAVIVCDHGGFAGDIHGAGVIGQDIGVAVGIGILIQVGAVQSHALNGQICIILNQDVELVLSRLVDLQSTVLQGNGIARQNLEAVALSAGGANTLVESVSVAAKIDGDGLIDDYASTGGILQ